MGLQDNSGDIILDVVLSDEGRRRLAKGDGSFKIVKFALGDDEIDYAKYNRNHASGSAYYDLDILQTPVMEALTNNTSVMHSKLITVSRDDLLYLPVLKLSETADGTKTKRHDSLNTFIVLVDENSEDTDLSIGVYESTTNGLVKGTEGKAGSYIRVDQGLDTAAISYRRPLDSDLLETQYIVEMDNRLGSLMSATGVEQIPNAIDDDDIAFYNITDANDDMIKFMDNSKDLVGLVAVAGPRGSYFNFRLKSSQELNSSSDLFDEIGGSALATTINGNHTGAKTAKYIDSVIKVQGVTTGYRLDIPVRYVKII